MIVEYSGNMSDTQRRATHKTVLKCQNKNVVVICSDVMSRGVDFPDVAYVVNYDTPQSHQSYVHRVGRTARAGRSGVAITMLKSGQEAGFNKMRSALTGGNGRSAVDSAANLKGMSGRKGGSSLETYRLPLYECEASRKPYQLALKQLEVVLKKEADNEIKVGDPL